MTCKNCSAATRLDRDRGVFVCDYCRSEFMPPAGEDGVQILGATKFKCPACEGMLSDGQMEFHPLFYCPSCRGMLISMVEFGGLIEALRCYRDRPAAVLPPRTLADGELARLCPLCSQAMDNHPYGGPGNVVIDTCEQCSVNWLDKLELQRIVVAPDHSYTASRFERYGEPAVNPESSRREL